MINRSHDDVAVTVLELLGQRGTGLVIRELLSGRRRYMDILNEIPNMSSRTLTKRLRELETAGVVRRVVYPETPVRIEYRLTPKGSSLGDVMSELEAWGNSWTTGQPKRSHA